MILKNKNILLKLPNTCSIDTAMAIAILEEIKIVIEDEHPNHIIFRNSLGTINNVKN
jgi:hypothetical protein